MTSGGDILGAKSSRVRALRRLSAQRRVRREQGLALVEGPVLIGELLDHPASRERIAEVFAEESADPAIWRRLDEAEVPVHRLQVGVLEKVLDTVNPQPLVATVRLRTNDLDDLPVDRPILVLVEIRDPGNLGTLLRTAEASGCGGLVLVGSWVDHASPKVVRAAAGGWARVPIVEIETFAELQRALAASGRQSWAAVLDDRADSWWSTPLGSAAIVLGNEAHGLSVDVVDQCDGLVAIDFDGPTESLNVAMAGTLLAFEALRQRRSK